MDSRSSIDIIDICCSIFNLSVWVHRKMLSIQPAYKAGLLTNSCGLKVAILWQAAAPTDFIRA